MTYDEAIVLKLSRADKEFIRQEAKKERLSVSAYVRQKMCSQNVYENVHHIE